MPEAASIEIKEKDGKHFLFQGDKEIGAYDSKAAAEAARDEMDSEDRDADEDSEDDTAEEPREKSAQIFRRFYSFRSEDLNKDTGELTLTASTSDPVNAGGFREVLNHAAGSIDWDAARAILVNHDPNQIAGPIHSKSTDGKALTLRCSISKDARLVNGVSVRDAIADGSLRGVSIGYLYDQKDAKYDDETRTITADRWRLLEGTLTPIPADPRAAVRRLPRWATRSRKPTMPDPILPAPAPSEAVVAAASERAVAAAMRTVREITALANSHKLDPVKYLEMSKPDASAAMLKDVGERDATTVRQPVIGFQVDASDKMKSGVEDAMVARMGEHYVAHDPALKARLQGNPYAGRTMQEIVRRAAASLGQPSWDWDRKDIAYFATGKPEMIRGGRNAANVTVSSFPTFIMLDAITKIVFMGYNMGGSSVNYQKLVEKQTVPDFKQFHIGGMAVNNLIQTAENDALPEMLKSEGVYNSSLNMWGGTLSLSFQAMVSDDTSQFDRNLRQAGMIAQRTVNKRVFQKLLMGTATSTASSTWTGNTTSGCSIAYSTADNAYAARTKLGVGRAALMNKTGLDGNPLGTIAKYLITGPTQEVNALGLMAVAPGQQSAAAYSYEVISSPWLEASALTGNSTTTYYLLADPNEVTGLVVSYLQGMESPQVQQYDPGATVAVNWKIWLPFEADLVWVAISGTNTIAGAQQCTT